MANPITEIDLTEFLPKKYSSFYMSERYSDITLTVEDQKLQAHRLIMGASSEYFNTLFSTHLNEPNQKEFIIEAPLKPFQIILKYFYTGKITLYNINDIEILIQIIDLVEKYCLFDLKTYFENYFIKILSVDNIYKLFEVARIYDLKELKNKIENYFVQILSDDNIYKLFEIARMYDLKELKIKSENYFIQMLTIDNIYKLFEIARMYDLKELKIKSLDLIDKNTEKILNSESFNKFSNESLEEILTRNSFDTFSQLCIFKALNEWSKSGNRNMEAVLPLLKWHSMTAEDFLIIRNLGNLTIQKIFDAFEKNITEIHPEDPNIQKFDENFASPIYNVRTFHGDMKLLNGNSTSYDENYGYSRHLITDENDASIIIDLRSIRIINHIKMLLWDRDDRSYSYFIEISTDYSNWKRIIDYSSYNCRTWQNLYFQAEPIKLIKIVGTNCSKNEYFDVVTFEAYLTAYNVPEIRDGFVVPKDNVALLTKGATILEGTSDYCINGDNENGYTCQDNNGCILIRLNQPYWISSIRLLLYDCGRNLRYKFKIQISLNMNDWETIVNQEEFVTSWQKFCFPSKLILFIKFIGTEKSLRDCSYYVKHFECPVQD